MSAHCRQAPSPARQRGKSTTIAPGSIGPKRFQLPVSFALLRDDPWSNS